MSIIRIPAHSLVVRPVTEADADAILEVYRQCEDFLALGPVSTASMSMVLQDLEISHEMGGVFCGIYMNDGSMIGVIDYVPGNFEGEPRHACLSLLMIAAPFRKKGIGDAVVESVEHAVQKEQQITAILSGVQVNNPHAIRFWQRHGYRIMGGPELMSDQTTVFHLRKDLDHPA